MNFLVSQTIKQIFYSIVHIHALCVCHCFNGCMYIQFVDIVLEAILFLNLQSQFCLYVLVHGCYNLHVYISLFLLIHVWLCTCFHVLLFSILYILCSIDKKNNTKDHSNACMSYFYIFLLRVFFSTVASALYLCIKNG